MKDTSLILKLLEQTASGLGAKIDDLSEKVQIVAHDQKEATDEHKIHERVSVETSIMLKSHLKSDEDYQKEVEHVLREINEKLIEYNMQLKIHIAGVNSIKEQNQLIRQENEQRDKMLDSRLEIAERPIKWVEGTGVLIKWIGVIASVTAALFGALKYLGKL